MKGNKMKVIYWIIGIVALALLLFVLFIYGMFNNGVFR